MKQYKSLGDHNLWTDDYENAPIDQLFYRWMQDSLDQPRQSMKGYYNE